MTTTETAEKRLSVDENSTEKGISEQERNSIAPDRDPSHAIVARFGALGPLLARLFDSGVEARGVERVPEDQRDDVHYWNNLFMWWSVNITLTTIPVGFLAQEFFTLTLPHTIATILCFGLIGATATSFIATLGPQTGLRTIIITRFSSGYVGGTIYSILNILTQLGWAVTAVILGGQTLASINPGTLPLIVGIIIVAVGSLVPCFIGYDMVHKVERYVWIPLGIIMLFLLGLGAKAGYEIKDQIPLEDTGRSVSADVMSFGGIVFSSFAGWAPLAADYNCRMPVTTSSTKVFVLTFIGLYIPICFLQILGALLMTITDPAYTSAFENGSTGGLISQVLSPWKGGGKFLLVLLAMSVIANNILNTYSAGLSMQSLGRPFAMIPRFFWTFIGFVVYTVAGIAGREHFSEILSNFLSILGYWTAWFVVVVAEEHFIFRRKNGRLGGYNLDDWDSPSKLPIGIAGILAGCFGVAGAVVGMAQVWYTGPIGRMAGGAFGTDLGFELAGAFAAVTYPVLRWVEIKFTGR
ncbi:cytosine-purine permease [Crucibulum laeve]|uniref:Cytosine-purine permease n=1 Tax=Crucibulum laeve TaxID=68775 RepID=A0A5C3LIV1_9AGAR|nr:cytosine-purine permease [Crucibulum laeve]